MIGVLSSEWLKLSSVRSTYYVLVAVAVFVAITAVLSWYAVHIWDGLSPAKRTHFAFAPEAELTSWLATLCLAVLGTLAITSEYSTGTIRASFTAVPRRVSVLAAKASIVAVVAFIVGEAAVVGAYGVSHAIVAGRPIRGQVSQEPSVLLAMGLSVAMFALLGLGLGALTRSAVAALATVVILWYVLPLVLHALPAPWSDRLGSFMPGALAGELADTGNVNSVYGHMLPPLAALGVMAGYAFVPLGVAAVLMCRRDA